MEDNQRDAYIPPKSKRTTNDDDNLSKTIINEDEDKAASIDKNPSSGAKKSLEETLTIFKNPFIMQHYNALGGRLSLFLF